MHHILLFTSIDMCYLHAYHQAHKHWAYSNSLSVVHFHGFSDPLTMGLPANNVYKTNSLSVDHSCWFLDSFAMEILINNIYKTIKMKISRLNYWYQNCNFANENQTTIWFPKTLVKLGKLQETQDQYIKLTFRNN